MNANPDFRQEVERIKQTVDLADLVRSFGVELRPQGKNLIGLCPFHDDKTPSLVITPDKNLWHCLGACSEGGSVIDWVMKTKNIEFKQALEYLKKENLNGKNLPRVNPPSSTGLVESISLADKLQQADDKALLKRVVEYYHHTLKKSPQALTYLQKRCLIHPELINTFKLGFANRTLGLRLPDGKTKEGEKIRSDLKRLGIFRKTGHEHFDGSLVIPVFDETGEACEIYGRKIIHRGDRQMHTYLPGPHKGVFNPAVFQSHEIILCESIIDALSFWANGFQNVTSSYGTNGFTAEHLQLLLKHQIKKVYIAYDADEAGDKAALKLAEDLSKHKIQCFRIRFEKGMDANAFIQRLKTPEEREEGLRRLIVKAEWMDVKSLPDASRAEEREKETAKKEKPETDNPLVDHSLLAAKGKTDEEAYPPGLSNEIEPKVRVKGEEVFIQAGPRHYRIRGLFKNGSFEVMRINLRVSKQERFFIDTLDLYQAKTRHHFLKSAGEELKEDYDLLKKELGRVMLKLEEILAKRLEEAGKPKDERPKMSTAEEREALAFLKSEDLLNRVAEDFETCGLTGERTNGLVAYLSAVSRKLETPLAVIIQSSSSAGKSTLMESILDFFPEEEKAVYTAMTGQSLFYMGETRLSHKILAVSEEEGAEKAQYAVKTLQSEGRLKIASTGKDAKSGKLLTQEYTVNGPVALTMTTTNIHLDEELQNRCFILSVNETAEQTQAIHQKQRLLKTLDGLKVRDDRRRLKGLHQNAQRLLKPIAVVNPYAEYLNFPTHKLRLRRDHMKYLNLIEAVALLHQYQREFRKTKTGKEYIEVELSDIETANQLSSDIFSRSLDELTPQSRNLLTIISKMVKQMAEEKQTDLSRIRFTRKQLREYSGWSDFQVKSHLRRLADFEYLFFDMGRKGQTYVYGLIYSQDEMGPLEFVGLTDPKTLLDKKPGNTDSRLQNLEESKADLEGVNLNLEPLGSPEVAYR